MASAPDSELLFLDIVDLLPGVYCRIRSDGGGDVGRGGLKSGDVACLTRSDGGGTCGRGKANLGGRVFRAAAGLLTLVDTAALSSDCADVLLGKATEVPGMGCAGILCR